MADNIKTLIQALPSVDTATGFVRQWFVTIQVSDGQPVPFTKDYSLPIQITNPTKIPTDYTAEEIISIYPADLDALFEHHKSVSLPDFVPPLQDISDFCVSQLSSGKTAAKK